MRFSLIATARICFVFSLCLSFTLPLFGQPSSIDYERSSDRKTLERLENQRAPLPRLAQFYGKLSKEQKKRITPSNENLIRYREFLKISKTGAVKILPNPKCNLRIVSADDLKCAQALPIPGMGSWYSFIKESHSASFRPDISLVNKRMFVGFVGNPSGLIVDLGDVEINSVNLNTAEVCLLNDFSPTKYYSEISKQRERFARGFERQGKFYKPDVLAKLNTVYAMRSTVYYKLRHFRFVYYFDDITLAFRIVDIDPEGAITLIWKELKKDSRVEVSRQ